MNLQKISVKLSFLLRHCKNPVYIELDGGWAVADVIIDVLREKYPEMNRQILDEIVATDNKTRYSYNEKGDKIRANQGHSIPGVRIEMAKPEPPELLYHGTARRFLQKVLEEGLRPMSRQYVHISTDIETAVMVGSRHGEPVVLAIRAKDFVADGNKLWLSANGVWQAKGVPPEYFSVLE